MSMVEKVAKAMAESSGFAWESCDQSQWIDDARAGIRAMLEPTSAMLGAGTRSANSWDGGLIKNYTAMINAALAEPLRPYPKR